MWDFNFYFKAKKGDYVTGDKYGAKLTTQYGESSVTFTKATLNKV